MSIYQNQLKTFEKVVTRGKPITFNKYKRQEFWLSNNRLAFIQYCNVSQWPIGYYALIELWGFRFSSALRQPNFLRVHIVKLCASLTLQLGRCNGHVGVLLCWLSWMLFKIQYSTLELSNRSQSVEHWKQFGYCDKVLAQKTEDLIEPQKNRCFLNRGFILYLRFKLCNQYTPLKQFKPLKQRNQFNYLNLLTIPII